MKTRQDFLGKGSPLLGLYVTMPDPAILEFAKEAGYDFVRIDGEHCAFDDSTILEMIRTGTNLDLPVHMRLTNLDSITKYLDFGLTGVVVPNCNTVEIVKEAIRMTKFHPLGARGLNAFARAVRLSGGDFQDYVKTANGTVTLIIQVEDISAMDHLDEMLALKGVDMVATGTADLSQSMGIPAQSNDPRVLEAENAIIRKTLEHGKQPYVRVGDRKRFDELVELGAKVFPLGSEEVMLRRAMKNRIQEYSS